MKLGVESCITLSQCIYHLSQDKLDPNSNYYDWLLRTIISTC